MHDEVKDVAASLESELKAMWHFALRLTSNTDDASDLVQRTCVRALEQRHNYSSQGKFRSWLFRIEHRIWLNELRSRKLRAHDSLNTAAATVESSSGHTTPLTHGTSADSLETNLYLNQVYHAVDRLPEAQRLVIELVSVEGFSYKEAAEILDVPIGTVMSRLARARVSIGQLQLENAKSVVQVSSTSLV